MPGSLTSDQKICIFFFKQKTAYEISTRDWSSEVCSSDLVDEAWDSYRLAAQFALSGINAMFIAPEAPAAKWESIAWPSLADLVRTVAGGVDAAMPAHRLVAAST